MDKKFGLDTVSVLHNGISEFFHYNWEKQMSVDEFDVGLHSRLEKTSNLDKNDVLREHLLLKEANLDSHHRYSVVGSSGGDYSLKAVATSLQNASASEIFPVPSMITIHSRHFHGSSANFKLGCSQIDQGL